MKNAIEFKEIKTIAINNKVYDTSFRHRVCKYALAFNSTKQASKVYRVGNSTVWRWMKTYGYATEYFVDRYLGKTSDTPFDRRNLGYSNDIRLSAVMLAVESNVYNASKIYNVSQGSIYNWIKAFGFSRLFHNK